MKYYLAIILFALASSLCFADSNGQANALYVKSLQLLKKSEALIQSNPSAAAEALGTAVVSLDKIVSDYPDSDVAVKIVEGKPIFQGFSLDQVHERIMLGKYNMMGGTYHVSKLEGVHYSENATEKEAKMLGDILRTIGYLDGKKAVDVILKKDEQKRHVVGFVVSGIGQDDKIVNAFRQIGLGIAEKGFGKPLVVRLMDTHLIKIVDINVN